jgi:single-strand DNA-binding protein
MSVNKVILVGFVGNEPEVRYLDSGTPVANFRLATSENYTNRSGEKVSQTEWHNVVVWRGLAEVVEKYVKKGSQLFIEGRIRTRAWDDRDGNKRYTTEIVTDNLQMLGRRGEAGDDVAPHEQPHEQPQNDTSEQKMDTGAAADSEAADDLPF